ncbi:class I SAM-dependent methyltransferase [Candidatus Micrarchaeota archaeon]|nr:class I SAM-dependent methyltransferase [Candidatus Micrarchaeota archaeon]
MVFDQAAYWKNRSKHYPEEFERHTPELRRFFCEQEFRFRQMLDRIDFSEVESVLEIGCGFGRMTGMMLKKLETAARYQAVDISPEQIKATKEKYGNRIQTRTADFRTEPFEPSDIVLVSEVFLHFPPGQIQIVLHKAQRLAKKYLIHIDPLLPVPESSRALAGRVKNYITGQTPLRWDWQHDYPRLYDYAKVDHLTVFPVGQGKSMIFLIKARERVGNRMPEAQRV